MSFDNVVLIIIYFVFIKSMAFGSDFNFYYVFKYGKKMFDIMLEISKTSLQILGSELFKQITKK